MVTIDEKIQRALVDAREALTGADEQLERIQRELAHNTKPSQAPRHARNKIAFAAGIIEGILARCQT